MCGRIDQTLNNITNDIIKLSINLKLTALKEKFVHLRKTSDNRNFFIFIKKSNIQVFFIF